MNLHNYSTNHSVDPFVYLKITSQTELDIAVAMYVVLMLSILAGNGLVLAAFKVNKRLRSSTNMLIMGLAVSDLLVGLVSIPCWLYIFLSANKEIPFSLAWYQIYITFDIFIGSASIMQLTALSIERCYAIIRPLRHRAMPLKVFYVMIAIPWLFAALVASLQPVQFERWKEVYTLLTAIICFFIPFGIILVAYLSIFRFARSKRRGGLLRHLVERRAYRKELRLSITLALITGLFAIAWLPLFVVTLIGTYYPHFLTPSQGTVRLLQFVKFCHYSNSVLDPLVYACRSREMICTLRYIASRLLCKKPSALSPSSSFRSSFRKCSSIQKRSTPQRSTLQNTLNDVANGAVQQNWKQKQIYPRKKTNSTGREKGNSVVFMLSAV